MFGTTTAAAPGANNMVSDSCTGGSDSDTRCIPAWQAGQDQKDKAVEQGEISKDSRRKKETGDACCTAAN